MGNLFLNGLFFLAWFLAFWLILRFQWLHALGQAFVLWLLVLLFVMPYYYGTAESVAEERAEILVRHEARRSGRRRQCDWAMRSS